MAVQYFKGDDTEKKFDSAAAPTLSAIEAQLDDFYEDAYSCAVLGDVLYDTNRAPLSNSIKKEIFRIGFASIFNAFIVSGSFNSYVTVFKAIFGDDVTLAFTVPGPGKLQISIEANSASLYDLLARHIENNTYLFDELVDYDGNNIAAQILKGFRTQYEVEQMLFELVPAGVYTEITLTVGG